MLLSSNTLINHNSINHLDKIWLISSCTLSPVHTRHHRHVNAAQFSRVSPAVAIQITTGPYSSLFSTVFYGKLLLNIHPLSGRGNLCSSNVLLSASGLIDTLPIHLHWTISLPPCWQDASQISLYYSFVLSSFASTVASSSAKDSFDMVLVLGIHVLWLLYCWFLSTHVHNQRCRYVGLRMLIPPIEVDSILVLGCGDIRIIWLINIVSLRPNPKTRLLLSQCSRTTSQWRAIGIIFLSNKGFPRAKKQP